MTHVVIYYIAVPLPSLSLLVSNNTVATTVWNFSLCFVSSLVQSSLRTNMLMGVALELVPVALGSIFSKVSNISLM